VHSVYDDEYLQENELWLSDPRRDPLEVTSPLEAESAWSCIRWNRRTYREVVGAEPSEVASGAAVGGAKTRV
jgi:hypothetical protein